MTFTAERGGVLPLTQVLGLNITGSEVAQVGAGFSNRPDPGWLTVEITGNHPRFDLRLGVTDTQRSGTLETVLTVGTADANGNILFTRDVPVRYTLAERLRVNSLSAVTIDAIYGHSDTAARQGQLSVTGATGRQWQLSSDQPWVQVPAQSFSGDRQLGYIVDLAALTVGQHTATVRLQNLNDANERSEFSLAVTITRPVVSVDRTALVFGESLGRVHSALGLNASLNTGSESYPFRLVVDPAAGWLRAQAAEDRLGSAAQGLTVTPDLNGLASGTYRTTLLLVAEVRGETISSPPIDVVLHLDRLRLGVSAHGVALSSLPGRSMLERRLTVNRSFGQAPLPWFATSDAAWLTVTPRGQTGEDLLLSANVDGLAADTLHLAHVTLTSEGGWADNIETVEVGLWVGTAPATTVRVETSALFIVADPVRPQAYASKGGETVTIHDVYSGAVLGVLRPGVSRAQRLTISDDGAWLYVHDSASGQVRGFDLRNRRRGPLYETGYGSDQDLPLLALHRHGVPLLIAGSRLYRAGSTPSLLKQNVVLGDHLAASSDGSRLVGQDTGLSPSSYFVWSLDYSQREGGFVELVNTGGGSGGSNGQDIALSPDGQRVFTANGGHYAFPVFDAGTGNLIDEMPGTAYPNAVETQWNGVFIGGVDAPYDTDDLFVYAADGRELTRLRASGEGVISSLRREGLRISGDGTRVITSAGGDVTGSAPVLSFQSLPAP